MSIIGELILADTNSALAWRSPVGDPVFNLRNATAGALQHSPAAWPTSIDLEGFSYTRLGGFGAKGLNEARNRPVGEWIAWLAKDGGDRNRYSPQPCTQLASVLAAAGRRDQANVILFAGRERERKEARRDGRWGQCLWLTILSWVCGYGIGIRTFRAVYWILGFAVLGTVVLWFGVPAAHARGLWWCVLASLDRLLPIVQLNRQFADFCANAHAILPAWVIVFYAALGIPGWVLGLLLIVALSGLTQRT